MGIRHREVFPEGSSPDSIDWRVWNDDHVGIAGAITQDQQDALDAANAPDAGNPFATIADVGGGGGLTPTVVHLTAAELLTGPRTLFDPAAGELLMWIDLLEGAVNLDSAGINVEIAPTFINAGSDALIDYTDGGGWLCRVPRGDVRGFGGGVRFWPNETPVYAFLNAGGAVVGSWQANHLYDTTPYGGLIAVVGNDNHAWYTDASGTSGAVSPDFAGNEGGTVGDNGITWTDAGAAPTIGSVDLLFVSVQT